MFLITSYLVTFIGLVSYWTETSEKKLTYALVGFGPFENVTVRKVAIVTLLFPISSPVLLFVFILNFLYWLASPLRYLLRVAIFGEE